MNNLHIIFIVFVLCSLYILRNSLQQNYVMASEEKEQQVVQNKILDESVLEKINEYENKEQIIKQETLKEILQETLREKVEEVKIPKAIESANSLEQPIVEKAIEKITNNFDEKISIVNANNEKIKSFLFIDYPDNNLKITWETAKKEIVKIINQNLEIINSIDNDLNSEKNINNYFKNPFYNKNAPDQFKTLISYKSGYQSLLKNIDELNFNIAIIRNTYNNFFNL